jgi:hypothetical protein
MGTRRSHVSQNRGVLTNVFDLSSDCIYFIGSSTSYATHHNVWNRLQLRLITKRSHLTKIESRFEKQRTHVLGSRSTRNQRRDIGVKIVGNILRSVNGQRMC